MRTSHFLGFGIAMLLSPTLAGARPTPSYAVAGTIAGPDGGWDYTSVDPVTHQVYVARADSVTIADPGTAKVRSVGSTAKSHAVVPIPDQHLLLVTSGRDDSVRLIDPATGVEKAKIAVGKDPDAALYDAATHRAVVINAKDGTVSLIDVAAVRVVGTIALKPGLEFAQLGKNGTLYVNNEDASEIETANLATATAGVPIALPGCTEPSGLAYDAGTDLLISACANGKAAVVDAGKHKLVGLLNIGLGADAVILDAARRLAFVPCGQSGVLTEIALDASGGPAVVATIPTERGARTGAVDPRDGTLYLPTAQLAAPVGSQKRGVPLPGSFHIIVVRPHAA